VRFVDTSVLLYAISRDSEEQGKAGEDYAGVRVENPFRAPTKGVSAR
jgi:predicted nucleic acid-binding protein